MLQGFRHGSAEATVRGRVLRLIGSDDEADPCRVGCSLRITVGIAGANRGHRPPEVVEILSIPAGNQSVGGCGREHREVARVVGQSEEISDGQGAPGAIPLERRVIGPESADVGLFCRSEASDERPQSFDLVVVACPLPAAEIRRRIGPELRRRVERKWLHEWRLWRLRGEEGWWCWDPGARTRAMDVGHTPISTVLSTSGEDRGGRLLAD